jgi:hypothetical protein
MRILTAQDGRGRQWAKRALKRLDAEYSAEPEYRDGKRVAVVLESGKVLCAKKAFKTIDAANSALSQIQLAETSAKTTPHWAYACPRCGLWHRTHAASHYPKPT